MAAIAGCTYDWAVRGERLHCVAPHRHGDSTTVIVRNSSTLPEMERRDLLTGQALADAQAALCGVASGQMAQGPGQAKTARIRGMARRAAVSPTGRSASKRTAEAR